MSPRIDREDSAMRAAIDAAACFAQATCSRWRGDRDGRGGQGRRGRAGRGGARRARRPPPAAPTPRWPDGKPILGSVPGQPVGGWGAGVTTLPAAASSRRFRSSRGRGRCTTSARSTSSNRIRGARHPACRDSFRRRTAPSSSRSPTCSACTSWTTAARTRTGSSTWTDARSRRTSRRPTTATRSAAGKATRSSSKRAA